MTVQQQVTDLLSFVISLGHNTAQHFLEKNLNEVSSSNRVEMPCMTSPELTDGFSDLDVYFEMYVATA